MFLIIVVFIAAFIALILFNKIKAVVCVAQSNIKLTIVLFFFIRLKKRFVIKPDKKSIAVLYEIKGKNLEQKLSLTEVVCRIAKKKNKKSKARSAAINYILKKTSINLKAAIDIATKDACLTALICGAVKAVYYAVKNMFGHKNHFDIEVRAAFAKQLCSVNANCIIRVSAANIIIGYFIYQTKLRR